MASVRDMRQECPSLQKEFDVRDILQQAQVRWLKPPEICEILLHYHANNFQLNTIAPERPPSGSLFLFDRKAVRHYRKDGHNWRKKNDGKTVREAHERLKVGSVEVLHCYYAHGDENANFQRRSYWMLDGAYENIVLVHYLEPKQVKTKLPNLTITNTADKVIPLLNHELPSVDSSLLPELGDMHTLCSLEDLNRADSGENSESLNSEKVGSTLQNSSRPEIMPEGTVDLPSWNEFIHSQDFGNQDADSSIWEELYKICNDVPLSDNQVEDMPDDVDRAISQSSSPKMATVEAPFFPKGSDYLLKNGNVSVARTVDDFESTSTEKNKICPQDIIHNLAVCDAGSWNDVLSSSARQSQLQQCQNQRKRLPTDTFREFEERQREHQEIESIEWDDMLQSMSFHLTQEGRGAETSIGKPNENTKADEVADSYNLKDLHKPRQFPDNKPGVQMDVQMHVQLKHPVNCEIKFSILDFSPDWGFSSVETKVLISGIFLGIENPQKCQWTCVFDGIEVPAKVTNVGVISCKAPSHCPGTVPFFVCCQTKSACSEVRQFEYRTKRLACSLQGGTTSIKEEDIFWKMQLARMLLSGRENETYDWDFMEMSASTTPSINLNEEIFQIVMKEKLEDWLVAKVNEGTNAVSVLNRHGQGLLHLVAALGYEWAVVPILAAGVGVNFRDACGWSALHWAAAHGRENAVLALLEAGAAAGPLTDPTPDFMDGQTPADLAASRGHHGLAGFLAEMSLTDHFKSLTIIENSDKEIFSVSADWEGEYAVEALADKHRRKNSVNEVDDQLSFEQSLRAVRNAAQTAALIRAAFRRDTFRKRKELEVGVTDEFGISPSQLKKIQYTQKLQKIFQARWKKRHTAATHIQSQFRAWRKRTDYLDLRDRVVKIQAHVRGYQVRKQYKKLVWAVGILEKCILRWRRKRIGLRDIHARNLMEEDTGANEDDDSFFEEGRRQKELIVEKAVQTVQSMVGSTEARAQYSRLLESSQKHNLFTTCLCPEDVEFLPAEAA